MPIRLNKKVLMVVFKFFILRGVCMIKNFIIVTSVLGSLTANNHSHASGYAEQNDSARLTTSSNTFLIPSPADIAQITAETEAEYAEYEAESMQGLYDIFGKNNVKCNNAMLYQPGKIMSATSCAD